MFGKFFASTFTGSMAGSGTDVFAVWGYVIANATKEGLIEINPPLVAAAIGCSSDQILKVLETLCSPDPNSRSKKHDGRRLIKVGVFLYSIPTYPDYRKIRDDADRREYMRDYMRAYRGSVKKDEEETTLEQSNLDNVNPSVNNGKLVLAKAEAEAEAEKKVSANADTRARAEEIYQAYPRKVKKPEAIRAIIKALKTNSAEFLLERTTAYAKTQPHNDRFTPHPATWFNGQQFNDDPELWEPEDHSRRTVPPKENIRCIN